MKYREGTGNGKKREERREGIMSNDSQKNSGTVDNGKEKNKR